MCAGRLKLGSPSVAKAGFCEPCTKTHDFIVQTLFQKNTAETSRLHREIVRVKQLLDGRIESKDFAGRFLERETELKMELEKSKRLYQKTLETLSQTKYLVKNKHEMTEKCKRRVKAMELYFADYDEIKTRVAELEKSVLKDSVVSDLAKRQVVIGRGPTPVKIFMRLRLQKFVPGVVPQPLVRVMTMV